MQTTKHRVPAADGDYPIEILQGLTTTVSPPVAIGSQYTGGTITLTGKTPGSPVWEAINGIAPMDLSAPVSQTVDGTQLGKLNINVSGVTGGTDWLEFTVTTSQEYR